MNKEVKRKDVAKGLSAICTDALAHSASLQLGETREAMSAIKSFSSLFAVTETCAAFYERKAELEMMMFELLKCNKFITVSRSFQSAWARDIL